MDVNYKRVNDTDGELTLRFSDYKELTRFLEVTKCRTDAALFRLQGADAVFGGNEVSQFCSHYKGNYCFRR